jgi:hypothetical protein
MRRSNDRATSAAWTAGFPLRLTTLSRVGPIDVAQGDEYIKIKALIEQIKTDVVLFGK